MHLYDLFGKSFGSHGPSNPLKKIIVVSTKPTTITAIIVAMTSGSSVHEKSPTTSKGKYIYILFVNFDPFLSQRQRQDITSCHDNPDSVVINITSLKGARGCILCWWSHLKN